MICFLLTFRFIFIFLQCALLPVPEQCTQEKNCWHCQGLDGIKHPIPTELKKLYRGCRAGAKRKAKRDNRRRRYKPFLPSVIMGNANSLPNECDELEALVRNQRLSILWCRKGGPRCRLQKSKKRRKRNEM